MKAVLQDSRRWVLRFDKDEELISGLKKFMTENGVSACAFEGIGSCLKVELGYYNSHIQEYRKKPILEELEIVNLTGNGGLFVGEPAVHVHGVFGRTDFSLIGGHVMSLTVNATCEIFLIKLEGALERKTVQDWNLNLLA